MRKRNWTCVTVAAVILMSAAFCEVSMGAASPSDQAGVQAPQRWDLAIAISISIGVSCLGAGYAVGKVGAAALGAASEKPELLTRGLLFVALAEGIAIYGLLIAVLLWIKLE